jgi:large subunit ribosomal protein L13
MMKTFSATPKDITQDWYVVDATGKTLGRLASQIARVLSGKHKPIFSPHMDTGDFVIIVNAEKIHLTGKKLTDKIYYRHSGWHGGMKTMTAGKMLATEPETVLQKAIKGMLPRTSLGRKMLGKCKIYRGAEHPHGPQRPKPLEF